MLRVYEGGKPDLGIDVESHYLRYGPMVLIGLIALGFVLPGGGPISLILGRIAGGIFSLLTQFPNG